MQLNELIAEIRHATPPRPSPNLPLHSQLGRANIDRMSNKHPSFEGCIFLGLSVDGFIARPNDDLTWLTSRGEAAGDAGFTPFMERIDALLMGRRTYQGIAELTEWPYFGRPIHVLSSTLDAESDPRIRVHADFETAVQALTDAGYARVYVDGGQTARAFIEAGLIHEITLSYVPVLIGQGVPLFGTLPADVSLEHIQTDVLNGGMVQTKYRALSS